MIMKWKKSQFILIILLVSIIVELGIQTYWKSKLSIYFSPLIYFILAITYLFIGYRLSVLPKRQKIFSLKIRINLWASYLISVGVIGYIVFLIWNNLSIFLTQEEIFQSDIIPSIRIYVDRLLSGERVYSIIHFDGYDLTPDYISLTWLPYIFPELIGMDYRRFSLLIFLVFVIIYTVSLLKNSRKNVLIWIIPFFSLLFLDNLVKYDHAIFGRTLELTIAVFYMILTISTMSKNYFVIVLGILLCLLSRYALSFWLVSYILILFFERGLKNTIFVNLLIVLGILIIYIPFIAHDLNLFVDGLKYYGKASMNEWRVHEWQRPGEKPYTLSQGFGTAIFYHDFMQGELISKYNALRISHLIISIISGLSIFVVYTINKSRIKNIKLFLIFGLKFFLMIFYLFIQIPYSYLYIVPLFISIPILGELISKNQIEIITS